MEIVKPYRLKGTYRRVGAIGAHEQFDAIVHALNSEAALYQYRAELYRDGFEHILFHSVSVA